MGGDACRARALSGEPGASRSAALPRWRRRDLLANVSGRHWDFVSDYQQLALAASDKTAYAIGLAQDARPGTVWRYNNAAIQTLDEVLTKATGTKPSVYARKKLLDPLETYWAYPVAICSRSARCATRATTSRRCD